MMILPGCAAGPVVGTFQGGLGLLTFSTNAFLGDGVLRPGRTGGKAPARRKRERQYRCRKLVHVGLPLYGHHPEKSKHRQLGEDP